MTTHRHGVLVVDKPKGMSSAAVVAEVKRRLKAERVGHTGTLDPMATGVLPLCLNEGTKLATFLLAEDKGYEGEFELGVETETLDAEGRVTGGDAELAAGISEVALAAAMEPFLGAGQQVPPMFSALRKAGRRLHELARRGEIVPRDPRPIHIDRFELVDYQPPHARFSVDCSKGTYIRSLVADLGAVLGCGAHLTALRRVRSGRFSIAEAVQLSAITEELVEERILSPVAALSHLVTVPVADQHLPAIANGRQIPWNTLESSAQPADLCLLVNRRGQLLAIVRNANGMVEYVRVFRYGLT